MYTHDGFLEKWQQCKKGRYSVVLIVPSHRGLLPELILDELAGLIEGDQIDFAKRYKGALETFFTWNKIQEEIYSASCDSPVVIANLEPFYSKWPIDERLSFLRYILRTETPQGIVLLLYCKEDLTEIRAIPENSRGLIWAP